MKSITSCRFLLNQRGICNKVVLLTSCREYSATQSRVLLKSALLSKTATKYSSERHYSAQIKRPYVDPKLSYVYGRSSNHLVYSTIDKELDRRVKAAPDELAFVSHSEKKRITFRQLEHDINKLAKSLVTTYNVKRGNFVGVFAYNCYNWIIIQLTCSRIGAILTPINPSYKSNELAYLLKKGKVKCLFMPGPMSIQAELNDHMRVLQCSEIVSMSKNKELLLENVILMDEEIQYDISYSGGDADTVRGDHRINFKLDNCKLSNWKDAQSDGLIYWSVEDAKQKNCPNLNEALIVDSTLNQPEDLFAVYYTSGTTGKPKGACISQFTAINNIRMAQTRLRSGHSDMKITVATTLPMFHIFAGVLHTLGPLCANTTVVYASYKYDLKAYVEAIIENNAYSTSLTPTILIDLLSYVEKHKLNKEIPLTLIQPGGAALAPELVTKTFKTLPNLKEIRTGYGSTENGSIATFQTIHEPSDIRAFTVGPPIDFTEVRIVKPETDTIVPLGEQGEIQTRGYNTMSGYLDDPEKTAQVFTSEGNWYKTGDIGVLHPNGSVQVNGRIKHMIIKGGENIYPQEVEDMIHKLDFVEKVHVIGVPDERFGEQVCAWVKLKSGYNQVQDATSKKNGNDICVEDIIEYCKKNITYFKVPKYVLFVDDFPMTPTKKVQAHLMVEESIKILGLKKATN